MTRPHQELHQRDPSLFKFLKVFMLKTGCIPHERVSGCAGVIQLACNDAKMRQRGCLKNPGCGLIDQTDFNTSKR
jgi:hypothetical protein